MKEVQNILLSFKFARRTLLFILSVFFVFPVINLLLQTEVFIIPPETTGFHSIYIVFVLILLYILFLLFKKKYRLSYWEYLSGIFILTMYLFLRWQDSISFFSESKWHFSKFGEYFTYFDAPVIIISIYMVRALFRTFNDFLNKFREKKYNSTFLEDNPISAKELKEGNTYNHLISKIAPALFEDVYKSSFSIGVIGPWGTGKSSFLKAVKYTVCNSSEDELRDKYDVDNKPDTIFIEFSPFLNHNEEQVIHEFFTQLSNKLSERSGRLSNLITIYSEKLANIADKNPWFSLFKIARNSRENRSAQELYADIQKCIEELNVKITVTVDDLDRLNAKEILQVLKLIRNTSNFPNMVFLVALDKEYVIQALREEKEYMKKRYLDKFFQLEITVPVNDVNILNKKLYNAIKKLKLNRTLRRYSVLIEDLSNEILNSVSFARSYIRSYRDINLLINNFSADLPFLHEHKQDLIILEYVQLTLLKMRFTDTFNKLSYHKSLFLQEDSNGWFFHPGRFSAYYNLTRTIIKSEEGVSSKTEEAERNATYQSAHGDVSVPYNHKIILTPQEIELIEITLSSLFRRDKVNSRSIKLHENFVLIVDGKPALDHFSRRMLMKVINSRQSDQQLSEFFTSDNFTSAFVKISDFYPENQEELRSFIDFLFKVLVLHLKGGTNKQYQNEIILILSEYVGRNIDKARKTDERLPKEIYSNIVQSNLVQNYSFPKRNLLDLLDDESGPLMLSLNIEDKIIDQIIAGTFEDIFNHNKYQINLIIKRFLKILRDYGDKKLDSLSKSKELFVSEFIIKEYKEGIQNLLLSDENSVGVKLDDSFFDVFVSDNVFKSIKELKRALRIDDILGESTDDIPATLVQFINFIDLIQKTDNKLFLQYSFSTDLQFLDESKSQFIIEFSSNEKAQDLISDRTSFNSVSRKQLFHGYHMSYLFVETVVHNEHKDAYFGLKIITKWLFKKIYGEDLTEEKLNKINNESFEEGNLLIKSDGKAYVKIKSVNDTYEE